MATVSNVNLTIGPGSTSDKRKVTVNYGLSFDATEVGRPYELSIDLLGEDKAGDGDATAPPAKIYSFGFPLLTHKQVIGQNPMRGIQQAVAEVSTQVLDEDPGVNLIHAGGVDVPLPRPDEVSARVTLAAKPSTATSNTVGLFL